MLDLKLFSTMLIVGLVCSCTLEPIRIEGDDLTTNINVNLTDTPSYDFAIVNMDTGDSINKNGARLNVSVGSRIKLIVRDDEVSSGCRRGGILRFFSEERTFEDVPWQCEFIIPAVKEKDYPSTCSSVEYSDNENVEVLDIQPNFTMYLIVK